MVLEFTDNQILKGIGITTFYSGSFFLLISIISSFFVDINNSAFPICSGFILIGLLIYLFAINGEKYFDKTQQQEN